MVFSMGNLGSAPLLTRPGAAHSGLAPFFSDPVQAWGASIQSWANDAGVDANLAATVMQIESCGDPQAVSSAGAGGLFQVMPFHFKGGEDQLDPQTNARRGLAYLQQALEAAGGDARLALAGYNGGIGVIQRGENAWPAETRRYTRWGAQIYQDAQQGMEHSQALQDWLDHGGARLCRQAANRLGLE